MAIITYRVSSYLMPSEETQEAIRRDCLDAGLAEDTIDYGEWATEDQVHASTGDAYVALSLFQGLMEDFPERTYCIEAYADIIIEDSNLPYKSEDGIEQSLLVHITGHAEEADLEVATFDSSVPETDIALEALGIIAA